MMRVLEGTGKVKETKKEKGVKEMTNRNHGVLKQLKDLSLKATRNLRAAKANYEFRQKLLKGGDTGNKFRYTKTYNDLIDELRWKAFDIAIIIINKSCLDAIETLDELDNIMVDLPSEFQDFYEEVLDRETKIEIEEELMEELEMELKYKEGYVIGYEGDKPKVMMNEKTYNDYLVDYEDEYYEDIEFVKTGPDFR